LVSLAPPTYLPTHYFGGGGVPALLLLLVSNVRLQEGGAARSVGTTSCASLTRVRAPHQPYHVSPCLWCASYMLIW
jgi:hypothetical protein